MTAPGRHPVLTPWWLVSHVVVLAVLVGFPQLSAWQWSRYHEEQAVAARQESRLESEPVPLAVVLPPRSSDFTANDAENREFQPVTVTGTWLPDGQVAQRNRSLDGQGGFDLLTPLEVTEGPLAGTAVMVRRGWVPPVEPAAATPTPDRPRDGEVEVTGFLEVGATQPSFGARDDPDADTDVVFHADLSLLGRRLDVPVAPMLVHLRTQTPGDGDLPVPQPAPAHDATQNLSYALQWAAFTIIVAVGYAIVLWRRIRDHRAGIDSDVDPLLRTRVPAGDAGSHDPTGRSHQ